MPVDVSQKLRPEAKEKVLEALRSERYKQGPGYLHNVVDDTWCCLGVASDAACEDGVEISREQGSITGGKRVEFFDSVSQYLPPQVADWLGLEDAADDLQVVLDEEFFEDNPEFKNAPFSVGEKTWLAELNDSGVRLSAIATLIERQW
jgi:hypothetical protein